jgi:hypothetical protein
MNERIQELAKQAGHRYYPSSNSGPLRVEYLTPELEKFAELIVRECANEIIEMADKYATFNGDIRRHIVHGAISEKLKEHFGVEE